jgi:arylsulfatase
VRGPFDAIGFEMFECRAIAKGDWKLIFMAPPYGKNDWQLFNLREDPREMDDLSGQEPEKLLELQAEWEAYARAVGYIEAGQTKQLEVMPPEDFFLYSGLE